MHPHPSPDRTDMLRLVIADDELAARRRLKRLLDAHRDYVIVGEFSDGQSAIDGIRHLRPDVALLDIQMPEQDGLEVAEAVSGPEGPAIVFVTAHDAYALRAFEVHAVDYLMKPIDAGRLEHTLERLHPRESAAQPYPDLARLTALIEDIRRSQHEDATPRRHLERLLVTVDGRSILVATAELDWIAASGNYVRLHRGQSAFMLRESLASIEQSLDPALFARVHRGAIVNISRIKEVQPWFSGAAVLILSTGQRLTLSRSYRKQFEARFGIHSED
jgi:two-component system, LytTR family, response regulator